MGQPMSKERERLLELRLIASEAQRRLARLRSLAAAEEAASIPSTPDSSQAAFQAAEQRLFLALDEYYAINRRQSEALLI